MRSIGRTQLQTAIKLMNRKPNDPLTADIARAALLAEEQALPSQLFHQKFVQRPLTRAVIALRRNAPAQALTELAAVKSYKRKTQFAAQYWRALAYQQLRRYDAALDELRTALAHRGWSPSSKLWPLLHLELARTQRMRGDASATRAAYESFFHLWRAADADAPFLAAAKAEYARRK